MSKGSLIMVLGILVAFLPSTGFPAPMPSVLAVIFGLAIIFLGFLVRQERIWLIQALEDKKNANSENASGANAS